ncbi:hypothetical protein AVEN_153661-1 [Araneus ventricosus]|uniref:Uncharacterized protein n=1 Tax=Araneus ventricosus TaxID=182803 RepID=A0A4Y2RR69_ARAVE|nr:hypothetical protein AVEN_153661-1 [Araneus ventricosus]
MRELKSYLSLEPNSCFHQRFPCDATPCWEDYKYPELLRRGNDFECLWNAFGVRTSLESLFGVLSAMVDDVSNGPYAPFGFESIKKQLWRNKQNDRPISDSEIKAVLSQLFKTDQWLPPAGHVSEDVTSHA